MAYYKALTDQKQRSRLAYLLSTIQSRGTEGEIRHIALRLLSDIHGAEKMIDGFFTDKDFWKKQEEKRDKAIQEKSKQKPAVPPLPCEEMVLEEVYAAKNMVTHYETLNAPAEKCFNVKCQGIYQKARFVIIAHGCTRDEFKHYEATVYANGMPVARFCEIPFVVDMNIPQMASKLLSWWMNKYVIKPHHRALAEVLNAESEAAEWSRLVRVKPNR